MRPGYLSKRGTEIGPVKTLNSFWLISFIQLFISLFPFQPSLLLFSFLTHPCCTHLTYSFCPRCLARPGRCWKYMQMVTYGWRLEARRGRSTQHASRPSQWRWTPTSWQPRTPTNLEVRPLPGRGGSSLTLQLQLYLLRAFSHSSLPSFQLCLCHACFHIQVATVVFMATVTAVPCLSFFSNVCTGCHFLKCSSL